MCEQSPEVVDEEIGGDDRSMIFVSPTIRANFRGGCELRKALRIRMNKVGNDPEVFQRIAILYGRSVDQCRV